MKKGALNDKHIQTQSSHAHTHIPTKHISHAREHHTRTHTYIHTYTHIHTQYCEAMSNDHKYIKVLISTIG